MNFSSITVLSVLLALLSEWAVRESVAVKEFHSLINSIEARQVVGNSNGQKLPPGLVNQSAGEEKYLRFHKCLERGEAFAASYFITKSYLSKLKTKRLNISTVNCAKASWLAMTKKGDGTVSMTLDVLDLSVIHMSAYERWMRSFKSTFLRQDYPNLFNVSRVFFSAAEVAKYEAESPFIFPSREKSLPELRKTIAAIPFYGENFGMTASPPEDRQAYVVATFWSVFIHIPRIVIFVENSFDEKFIRNANLPFFDIVHLNIPKPGGLPVATVVAMQERLAQDVYADFDYFYFTEADQMLVLRSPNYVFKQLKDNPMFTVVPHRLVPYAKQVHDIVFDKFSRSHKQVNGLTMRKQDIYLKDSHFGWMRHSCCMPRQNCLERDEWVPLLHPSLPYMNIFGLHVALGNSNFHKLSYRPCKIYSKDFVDNNFCP